MNLPEKYCKGKFIILPIEYEKDVTYGNGAALGSSEIIKASTQLEYYDEQFDTEHFLNGIELLKPLRLDNHTPEQMVEIVSNAVAHYLSDTKDDSKNDKKDDTKDKFLVSLGGDHSVTIGIVKGLEKVHEDFSVIILDAHSDCFHSWNGSTYNHRCVTQRVSEKHEVALIGVRSMDKDENEIIKNKENVHLIKSYELTKENFSEVLKKLKQKVYISIDVDVFDPSFIRDTGTPEPGGLWWEQVVGVLREIFKEKEVIGVDVVEFAPKENFRAEAYALAKLCYKIMGMKNRALS